jgi:hypothetical protein
MAKRKKKKQQTKKHVSDEPDGDYDYMRRRKELLKGSKKKLRQIRNENG